MVDGLLHKRYGCLNIVATASLWIGIKISINIVEFPKSKHMPLHFN